MPANNKKSTVQNPSRKSQTHPRTHPSKDFRDRLISKMINEQVAQPQLPQKLSKVFRKVVSDLSASNQDVLGILVGCREEQREKLVSKYPQLAVTLLNDKIISILDSEKNLLTHQKIACLEWACLILKTCSDQGVEREKLVGCLEADQADLGQLLKVKGKLSMIC